MLFGRLTDPAHGGIRSVQTSSTKTHNGAKTKHTRPRDRARNDCAETPGKKIIFCFLVEWETVTSNNSSGRQARPSYCVAVFFKSCWSSFVFGTASFDSRYCVVVLVFTSFFWILSGGGEWGEGGVPIPLVRVYQVRRTIGAGTS